MALLRHQAEAVAECAPFAARVEVLTGFIKPPNPSCFWSQKPPVGGKRQRQHLTCAGGAGGGRRGGADGGAGGVRGGGRPAGASPACLPLSLLPRSLSHCSLALSPTAPSLSLSLLPRSLSHCSLALSPTAPSLSPSVRSPTPHFSDAKVANRDIRAWHGATENGP